MSSLPVEHLLQRAVEQRRNLHQTTAELKARIIEKREQLDVKRNIRRHLPAAALIAAGIGLLSGYGLGDSLIRHQ